MTHRHYAFLTLLLVVALSLADTGFAQGYRGKDFWIAFPRNARIESNFRMEYSIFIAAERRAAGRIEFSDGTAPITFGVEGGASTSIQIDTSIELLKTGVPETKAIHLTATQDITVYVLSHRAASADSYAAIPTPLLGTEYIVAGFAPLYNSEFGFSTQAVAIATEDQTEVSILLSDSMRVSEESTEAYPAGHTLTYILNRGQTLRLSSEQVKGGRDLSGSIVTSNKPIAFLTGHTCAQVPADVSFCDMLLEMEPPADRFGTDFLVPAFAEKASYVARVFASSDSTTVTLGDSTVALLSSGAYWQSPKLTRDVRIRTSRPALTLQFATSAQADRQAIGDPFVLGITPHERFINEATAVTLAMGQWDHFVTIVTDSENVSDIRIDGQSPDYASVNGGVHMQPILRSTMPPVVQPSDSLVGNATIRSTIRGGIVAVPIPDSDANAESAEESTPRAAVAGDRSTSRYAVVRWQLRPGRHLVYSSKPFAIYEYGFGGGQFAYDSYGSTCGEDLTK